MTTGSQQPADPAGALDFDDPLSLRSADDTDTDTDSGWGEGAPASGGSGNAAADLARFLDEKPPHHL